MRVPQVSSVLMVALAGVQALAGASRGDAAPVQQAPGATSKGASVAKFIPSFAVCYSDAAGARPPEETARFDMLVASFGHHSARAWGRDGGNSWETLKRLNPAMTVAIYAMGPGEYNTASWGQIGEGWDWLAANHGKGSADCWVALGQKSGGYLRAGPYANERLMDLGNTNWRRYWIRAVLDDYWGGRKAIDCRGADAVFIDNTQYQMIWTGQWLMEGRPDRPDEPATTGPGHHALKDHWREDVNRFLAEAMPAFRARGLKVVLNFGYMGQHPEYWSELDALPDAPFAAMEEGGFVCPWGGDQRSFKSYDWEKRVEALRGMHKVKVLMNNHAGPFAGEGLARMDTPDANGTTGWDALWFSLASFLLGYDDVSHNAFLSFTVWGYREYHWFDEFDPAYLHLGRARGNYIRSGKAFLREFDDGWVAVNPGKEQHTSLKVPGGRARVLDHRNFKAWRDAPLVDTFDLPPMRGVVLLREGRAAGNTDNLAGNPEPREP
jgi:hypothetical protein